MKILRGLEPLFSAMETLGLILTCALLVTGFTSTFTRPEGVPFRYALFYPDHWGERLHHLQAWIFGAAFLLLFARDVSTDAVGVANWLAGWLSPER